MGIFVIILDLIIAVHCSTLRTGVVAIKIGVIPQWTKAGEKFYTTILQVGIDSDLLQCSLNVHT